MTNYTAVLSTITERLNVAEKALNVAVTEALFGISQEIEKQMREGLLTVSNGRVYTINGKKHIASAPGDMPNKLTGTLLGALKTRIDVGTVQIYVDDAEAPYAKWLEHGTSRIDPRPFFYNTIYANEGLILAKLKEAIDIA
jgi:hypothetical protein